MCYLAGGAWLVQTRCNTASHFKCLVVLRYGPFTNFAQQPVRSARVTQTTRINLMTITDSRGPAAVPEAASTCQVLLLVTRGAKRLVSIKTCCYQRR
jgi:hypothetical protein